MVAVRASPVVLRDSAFLASVALAGMEAFVGALPTIFGVGTLLARIPLGDIEVAVEASPVVLSVAAFAAVSLGVVEVTVVASPAVFGVAAFAAVTFGIVPPVSGIGPASATLHGVSGRIAEVASGACPVIFSVFAGAGIALVYLLLAILALPAHLI